MQCLYMLFDAGSTILVTLLKFWIMRISASDETRLVMILSSATSMIETTNSYLMVIAAEFKLVG